MTSWTDDLFSSNFLNWAIPFPFTNNIVPLFNIGSEIVKPLIPAVNTILNAPIDFTGTTGTSLIATETKEYISDLEDMPSIIPTQNKYPSIIDNILGNIQTQANNAIGEKTQDVISDLMPVWDTKTLLLVGVGVYLLAKK